MTYKYKLPAKPFPTLPAKKLISQTADAPELSGVLQGKKASDIEEVFGIALDNHEPVQWWSFRNVYGGAPGTFGSIELDFLIYTGALYPVQLDEDWIHHTAQDKAHDMLQDARLNEILRPRGARPVERIKGSKLRDGRVANQERADRLVQEMFG